jgi:hypothetical protein
MNAKPAWKLSAVAALIFAAAGAAQAADETTKSPAAKKAMEEVVVAAPLPARSTMEEIAATTSRVPPMEAITLNLGELEIARPELGRPIKNESTD